MSAWVSSLSKGTKTEPVGQMKRQDFPIICCMSSLFCFYFLLDLADILSVPRPLCSFRLFHVCVSVTCNRDTCLSFSLVFERFFFCFTLAHQTKLRPVLSLSVSRKDGEERRSCPVDIGHFPFYFFVPYAALLYACFLMLIGNI